MNATRITMTDIKVLLLIVFILSLNVTNVKYYWILGNLLPDIIAFPFLLITAPIRALATIISLESSIALSIVIILVYGRTRVKAIYEQIRKKRVFLDKVKKLKSELTAFLPEQANKDLLDFNFDVVYLTLREQEKFFEEEKEKIRQLEEMGKRRFASILQRFNYILGYIDETIRLVKKKAPADLAQLDLNNRFLLPFKENMVIFMQEYNKAVNAIEHGYISTKIGLEGEEKVNNELEIFRDVVKNLGSVRLEVEGTTVEADHIVLAEKGIFCIETKNIGALSKGDTIHISKDGLIRRYNQKGQSQVISDFISQVYRHVGIIQRFLNQELKKIYGDIPYIPLYPIIVIANENIVLRNESDIPVVRTSSLYHYITSYKSDKKLDRTYWNDIENILKSNDKGPKAYPVNKYADKMRENYTKLAEQISLFSKVYDAFKSI